VQTCYKYKVTETKQSYHKHGVHIISTNMQNISKQIKIKIKIKRERWVGHEKLNI